MATPEEEGTTSSSWAAAEPGKYLALDPGRTGQGGRVAIVERRYVGWVRARNIACLPSKRNVIHSAKGRVVLFDAPAE